MFKKLKIYKDKLIYKESYRSYKDDAFKIYPRKIIDLNLKRNNC